MAKTLDDIPASKVWQAQQAALMRLQLYLVMRTHEILRGVLAECRDALEEAQGEHVGSPAGEWDGLSTHLAIEGVTRAWRRGFEEWKGVFEALRAEAAAIPFGTLAVLHREAFGEGTRTSADERGRDKSREGRLLAEASGVVFEPQLRAVLDGARDRVWGDGFNLSQRIWRLDQESLEGIRRIVYEGVASKNSAWNIAKKLEGQLGAGSGCPRWARSRLYKLTKSDIAGGNRMGLYSGGECDGQGVSYNALRLARNEIQIAHHRATDLLMERIPWIEMEQVHLSPAHPEDDVCDDVIASGERGEGIYQKGTIQLPLHVQCLCWKSGVLMPPDEFSGKLRGWLNGTEGWAEMDEYAGLLGVGREGIMNIDLAQGMAGRLLVWLWGGSGELDAAAGAIAN